MLAALPVFAFVGLTLLVLARSGFTPDEEITAVAARAIGSTGLPLLPSGVLYPRGLPHLYAAWLASTVLGANMVAWRAVSLLAGAAGVLAAWRVGARFGGAWPAMTTALLLATLPPYVAAGAFARPYAALMAVALLLLTRDDWPSWTRTSLVVLATLLHPLGLSLAVLPVLAGYLRTNGERTSATRESLLALTAGVGATGLVYGAHWWSLRASHIVSSLDTAVYAIPTGPTIGTAVTDLAGAAGWAIAIVIVLILGVLLDRRMPRLRLVIAASAVFAATDRLGFLLLVGFAATLMKPRDIRRNAVVMVAMFLVGAGFWAIHTSVATDGQLTLDFVRSLTVAATGNSLGQLRFALAAFPVLTALALIGLGRAVAAPEAETSAMVRGLSLLLVALLVVFSVAMLPGNERYLLLPWVLLTVIASAGATELARFVGAWAPARRESLVRALSSAAILVCVWAGHVAYAEDRDVLVSDSFVERALAPLTGPSWTPDGVAAAVEPSDTIVCTEELACVYLLGRVDFLFALPPTDDAHYVVRRDGETVGFYAGAPSVATASDLRRVIEDHAAGGCTAVIALRSGKVGYDEYLEVLNALRAQFDVRDVVSRQDLHVSRVCQATGNARLTGRMP